MTGLAYFLSVQVVNDAAIGKGPKAQSPNHETLTQKALSVETNNLDRTELADGCLLYTSDAADE